MGFFAAYRYYRFTGMRPIDAFRRAVKYRSYW